MVTKTTRIVTGDDGSKQVEDRLVLGNAYEGPPRAVHGGIVAALFDELLGSLQRVAGLQAYTGELTIRYRALTPLHEELVFLGWIDDVRGRLIKARATCHAADTLTAEATALFIGIDLLAETGQRQAAAPSTRHRRLD
jgi:acyl-coenzyme A thioesterase PaaI-like protein